MTRISKDEARHARLSWEVAAWIETKLDEEARRRVKEARQNAVEALGAEASGVHAPEVVRATGVPSGAAAHALFNEARQTLWA